MTRVLEQAGHTVVGLDSYYYEDCVLGQAGSDITALRKDVRDVAPQDLKGFDAVVHLAALSNDPLGELNPDWTCDINYHASVKLAQAAKDAGVRLFLYSSSCSMYGAAGDDAWRGRASLPT